MNNRHKKIIWPCYNRSFRSLMMKIVKINLPYKRSSPKISKLLWKEKSKGAFMKSYTQKITFENNTMVLTMLNSTSSSSILSK